jgi:hypothetical protein
MTMLGLSDRRTAFRQNQEPKEFHSTYSKLKIIFHLKECTFRTLLLFSPPAEGVKNDSGSHTPNLLNRPALKDHLPFYSTLYKMLHLY